MISLIGLQFLPLDGLIVSYKDRQKMGQFIGLTITGN